MPLKLLLTVLALYGFPTSTYDVPQAQFRPTFFADMPNNTALVAGTLASGINLLAAASRAVNPGLTRLWGTTDAPSNGRMLVRGISIEIAPALNSTAALRAALVANMTLIHVNATRTLTQPVQAAVAWILDGPTTDTTTAGAGQFNAGRARRFAYYRLQTPIWVNCETDSLQLGTAVAVNIGAVVPALVTIDGIAFQTQADIVNAESATESILSTAAVAARSTRDIIAKAADKAATRVIARKA